MKLIDRERIASLLQEARTAPRRRTHYNLHASTDEPINRLVVAASPETVVAPHRHLDKFELFTILAGKLTVYTYDDAGEVVAAYRLGEEVSAIEIPAGVWHNFVAETPCAALEVKPGPYAPLTPEESAPFPGRRPESC